MSDIIVETRVAPEEFMPVHDVFVDYKHPKGTLRIKLARLYLEGIQDSESLGVELPEALKGFIEFVKEKFPDNG